MPTIVCGNCGQSVAANAHCSHCGHALRAADTNITSETPRPTSQAISEEPLELPSSGSPNAAIQLPEHYASWEEFRALSPALQRELLNLAMTPLPDLRGIDTLPMPEQTRDLREWGKPLGTLEISGQSQFARGIGKAILFAFGIYYVVAGIAAIFEGIGNAAFTVFAIGAGTAMLWAARKGFQYPTRLSLTLWIFQQGLLLQRGGQLHDAAWQDIDGFEISYETGRPLYWLTLKDEDPIILSMGHCPEVVPLMEYVEIRMAAAQLLPRLEAIWRGDLERFGTIALDCNGISQPQNVLRWSEVDQVIRAENTLFIDVRHRPDGVSVRYRDVSFPTLVMTLARILIEEHKRMKP